MRRMTTSNKNDISIFDLLCDEEQKMLLNILNQHDEDEVSIDMADVNTILSTGYKAKVVVTTSSLMLSKYLVEFSSCKGILIHFYLHREKPLAIAAEIMEKIYELVPSESDIIFGMTNHLGSLKRTL